MRWGEWVNSDQGFFQPPFRVEQATLAIVSGEVCSTCSTPISEALFHSKLMNFSIKISETNDKPFKKSQIRFETIETLKEHSVQNECEYSKLENSHHCALSKHPHTAEAPPWFPQWKKRLLHSGAMSGARGRHAILCFLHEFDWTFDRFDFK
jgi:hypothetical protein